MLARKTPLKRTAVKRKATFTMRLRMGSTPVDLKAAPIYLKRTPIRQVSKKRASQVREYSKRRAGFLIGHPICEVWCKENGWIWLGYVGRAMYAHQAGIQVDGEVLSRVYGAPTAMEIHHMAKRRGAMLNDESQWLAVCRANHERIENNKTWARANGFLQNF